MRWEEKLASRTARMEASAVREILKVATSPGVISLAGGLPAAESFPLEIMEELMGAVLGRYGARALQWSGRGPLWCGGAVEGVCVWGCRKLERVVAPRHAKIESGGEQGTSMPERTIDAVCPVTKARFRTNLGAGVTRGAMQATGKEVLFDCKSCGGKHLWDGKVEKSR